jgi:integrase
MEQAMPIKKLLKVSVREKFDWKQLPDGCWRMSLGVRGCRVRVLQRKPGGDYIAITWIGRRRAQVSLKTSVRSEARAHAEAFMLRVHERDEAPARPLTLGRLWTLYQHGSGGYQSNTPRTRIDKGVAARRLFKFFDEEKRVEFVTRNDVERYLVARSTGAGWPGGGTHQPVRTRTAADDLCLLRAMIRWALGERKANGEWLLSVDPWRGIKLPKEENPRRPVIGHERYEKMRAAAQDLARTAPQQTGRSRWLRFELALVIAEATAARIGSIQGLRWSDVDHDQLTIRWDPKFHKRRRETIVPITQEFAAEFKAFQVRLGAVGDVWRFPRQQLDAPWPREIFRQLWVRAEDHAKLAHIKGGCWHTLRRKWAIERKHLPPVDVAGAGGWKDLAVLQTIYQIPTEAGMREVMSHQGKLLALRPGAAV